MKITDDFDIKISLVTQSDKASPPPLMKNHSCIAYNDSLIFFGGFNSFDNTNQLYIFSLSTKLFSKKIAKGEIPKPRNGHTATFVPSLNSMIMIGGWLGEDALASDEIYSLNLEDFRWKQIHSNPSISSTNMHTADLYKDIIYIFRGGNGISFLSDLTAYNVNTHAVEKIKLEGKAPSARANHMSSIIQDNLFIFGGWSGSFLFNDLYCINLTNRISYEIEYEDDIVPSCRAGARMVSSNDNYLILFGGYKGNGNYLNDLFLFNYESNKWILCKSNKKETLFPSPRAGHSMTIVNGKLIYIYGGSENNGKYCNQLYEIDIDVEPKMEINEKEKEIDELVLYKEVFFNSVRKMFNNKLLSDIIIIVDKKTMYAHRLILSILSEKFQNMFEFEENQSNEQQRKIKVKGYKYTHFELFIKFLYLSVDYIFFLSNESDDFLSVINHKDNFELYSLNSLNLSENSQITNIIQGWTFNDYLELLRISDEYIVPSLKYLCEKKIATLITNANYSLIEAFAKKFCCTYLTKYLKWYYEENKMNIILEEYTIMISSEDNSVMLDKSLYS